MASSAVIDVSFGPFSPFAGPALPGPQQFWVQVSRVLQGAHETSDLLIRILGSIRYRATVSVRKAAKVDSEPIGRARRCPSLIGH